VKSAVSALVMPYFTSRPASPVKSLSTIGRARRSVRELESTYGFASRLTVAAGTSRSVSVAAAATCSIAVDEVQARLMGTMNAYSFFVRIMRRMLIPHVRPPAA
jgi:hypothetical protein